MTNLRMISIACLVVTSTAVWPQGHRLALAIGNDTYEYANHLINPGNDASAMGAELSKIGFQTTVELDLNKRQIVRAIEKFSSNIHSGDTVFFYYAGHGLQVDGENLLVPTDFNAQAPGEAKLNGYSLSDVLDQFISRGAATKIIVLDSCRDNPFLVGRSLRGGWAGIGTSAGTLVAFGTSPGSTAADEPGRGHGLFTQMLLNRFESPTDIEKTFQLVREDVISASSGGQVPWVASSLVSEFHLILSGEHETATVSLPDYGFPGRIVGPSRTLESRKSETPVAISQEFPNAVFSGVAEAVPLSQQVENGLTAQQEQVLLEEAMRLAETGDYDDSVRSLHTVLDADPRSSLALRILGLVFHLMGRGSLAKENLDRAIALNMQDPIALYYRCLIVALSAPTSAIRDCEASISIDPGNANVYCILASALLALGQTSQAEQAIKQAITLDPDNPLVASVHGKVLMRQGHLGAAESEFRRAILQNETRHDSLRVR